VTAQTALRPLPSSTAPDWADPTVVEQIDARSNPASHRTVHVVAQPDCPWCPAAPCPCGVTGCPQVSEHRRSEAGAETTWRQVAA
jgi:hypothetical protein